MAILSLTITTVFQTKTTGTAERWPQFK